MTARKHQPRKRAQLTKSAPSETVLFAVTGMSPAILTETVWALANETPAIIPDRVVVLTTLLGAQQIREELFKPLRAFKGLCVWDALRKELGHRCSIEGKINFGQTADDIRVFTKRNLQTGLNQELKDIRTPSDNVAVADFILEKLRSFTENPEIRVIASIAGGRKTMGALLYACITLVGRETDRLTHVLVNSPYDSPALTPKFYFPCAICNSLKGAKPQVELADVPFVPLRNKFAEIADTPGNFSRLVTRYSKQLRTESSRKVSVTLDSDRSTVTVDGESVVLRKRAFLVLSYLVHINSNRGPIPFGQPEAVDPLKAFLGEKEADWVVSADDIKRELSEIRKKLLIAGIAWIPGERRNSLRLPPFNLKIR